MGFEPHGAGTRMTDVVTFRMALGPLADVPVGFYLRRLMRIRNTALRSAALTLAMDTPDVDDFTRHHLIVTELVAKLPTVRNDPSAFAFECAELRKHLAKLEEFGPTG